MNITALLALFGAMVVLAALPSVSVLAVAARSVANGFRHGVYTALGVVLGDLIFIVIAVCGLSVLAEWMGPWFGWVGIMGGLYVVWVGVAILRSRPVQEEKSPVCAASPWSSVLAGLAITLADQKAIIFYLGFFPAFLELASLSVMDVALVMLVAAVAVGSVKILYAVVAVRSGSVIGPSFQRTVTRVAGITLISVGLWMLCRTGLTYRAME